MKTCVLFDFPMHLMLCIQRSQLSVISFNRDIKFFNRSKAFPVFLSRMGCRGQYSKAVAQFFSFAVAQMRSFLYMVFEISLILSVFFLMIVDVFFLLSAHSPLAFV